MSKVILSVLAVGSICMSVPFVASAAQSDDVVARIEALEKENAAIRKENAALREKRTLRQQNTELKSQFASQARTISPPSSTKRSDPFGAYAADLPAAYKAPIRAEPGQLRLWAEGGAIWSGGDPINSFFFRTAITPTASPPLQDIPGSFAIRPHVGWEAASGFDYRFAGSPWHVSGQFRYGEATRSVSAAFSGTEVLPGAPPVTAAFSDAPRSDLKETHWLADMALGRDIIGNGPDAMQFKFGVRVAELRSTANASNPRTVGQLGAPVPFFTDVENVVQESKFLGAGPRIGIDGSAPVGMGWTFDYLGDVAALFGTQRLQRTSSFADAAILGTPETVPSVIEAAQKFGAVFNADVQVGVSYWMAQNMKITASYRLDAFFNVLSTLDAKNDPTRLQRIDRYTHGPRLAVTAQF